MKRTFLIISTLIALAISASAQRSAAAKSDPAKGVREAFDRLVDGIKTVDVDKVMSTYEKNERLLIFNNNGTATNSWDNIKSNVTATFGHVSNVTLDITGLRIEMLGKTAAFVTCKWKQTQEYDGKLENASGRMSLVFKLVGKDWKIAHRHTSPDKPDSTRPLFPSEREN